MNLREELAAALVEVCEDPKAWVPLRRAQVEAVLVQLAGVEALLVAARALVEQGDAGALRDLGKGAGEKRKKDHAFTQQQNEGLVQAVLDEIKRTAVDGVAPRIEEYELKKAPNLPTYKQFYNRCHVGWIALVEMAGL